MTDRPTLPNKPLPEKPRRPAKPGPSAGRHFTDGEVGNLTRQSDFQIIKDLGKHFFGQAVVFVPERLVGLQLRHVPVEQFVLCDVGPDSDQGFLLQPLHLGHVALDRRSQDRL